MSLEEIKDKIVNILSSELNVQANTITLDKSLKEDFDADSMTIVALSLTLQEELHKVGVEIEDQELLEVDKISNIVDLISSKLGKS